MVAKVQMSEAEWEAHKREANRKRQAEYKARRLSAGLVQCVGMVPKSSRAEVMLLMRRLIEDPSLEIGLRSKTTGRFERL